MISLKGNLFFLGKIECLTGLHIGGSGEKFEIGGVDSPVIRDPYSNFPYIPGSSIKGKARMMLELLNGRIDQSGKPHKCVNVNCEICRLFGTSADTSESGPGRMIFRDAYPDSDTIRKWKTLESELIYTELKPENTINRLTSSANPRFLERVIKGSRFNFEMVFSLYEGKHSKPDQDLIEQALTSLKLIEDSNLGGSGSRGYGKIRFHLLELPIYYSRKNYQEGIAKLSKVPDHDEIDESKFKKLSEFIEEDINKIKKMIEENDLIQEEKGD